MQFRLSTLLIVLALGPPLLAGGIASYRRWDTQRQVANAKRMEMRRKVLEAERAYLEIVNWPDVEIEVSRSEVESWSRDER